MVFGLFSRKPQPQIPAQEVAPEIPTASGSSRTIEQLRTPSPSVDSASVGKPPYSPRTALDASPEHYAPPITPSPPPEEDLGLITDPTALHDLIRSVPHKTFQEYVLDHLKPSSHSQSSHLPCEPPSPRTLTHLTSFFSALTPPPRLHCVRCHKDYYDVENDDRSCFVPHDDDSAEVERLSVAEKRVMNADFETLYGCCGSSVAGDGDMGPPDGWCYEGKHTVRFHVYFIFGSQAQVIIADGPQTRSVPRRLDPPRRQAHLLCPSPVSRPTPIAGLRRLLGLLNNLAPPEAQAVDDESIRSVQNGRIPAAGGGGGGRRRARGRPYGRSGR